MRYSPDPKGGRVSLPAILLLAAAVVCVAVPSIPGARDILPRSIVQFAGVVFGAAGIYLLVRFRFVTFTYAIAPRDTEEADAWAGEPVSNVPACLLDFYVYKATGRRPAAAECILSVGDLLTVAEEEKRRGLVSKYRREREVVAVYDYTASPRPGKITVLVFGTPDGNVAVAVECDEKMTAALKALARETTNGGNGEKSN